MWVDWPVRGDTRGLALLSSHWRSRCTLTLALHLRALPCAQSSAPRGVMSTRAPQAAASLLMARACVSGFPCKHAATETFWPEPGPPGASLSWSKEEARSKWKEVVRLPLGRLNL